MTLLSKRSNLLAASDSSRWWSIYAMRKAHGVGGAFRGKERELPKTPEMVTSLSYRSQKYWRQLPFVLEQLPFPLGYFVKDGYLYYKLRKVQDVLWIRKSQKVITETYVKHAAKTNGWHIR